MSALVHRTMSPRVRAYYADAEARDAIAELLDRHLASVPTIRTISARLLTRSPARRSGNTGARITRDLQLPAALRYRLQRRGAGTILALRDEIALTRIAFCFRDRRATWPLVAETIGVTHISLLQRMVRRRRRQPPSRWRLAVTTAMQLGELETFLRTNAPLWKSAMRADLRARGSVA